MTPTFAAKVDTTALKQALIQACIGNVKFIDHLQVMGVLCVSVDDEPLEIVVKVNDLLQKRPSVQVQQDRTGELVSRGGKLVSSGSSANRTASAYVAAAGRGSEAGKQQSGADVTKQHQSADNKLRTAGDTCKVLTESTKQQVTETVRSTDVGESQAGGSEPKRMRIITVGEDVAKQKLAVKASDGDDHAAGKDVKEPRNAGSAQAGDTELAALQLLALKASRSSPSVNSQAQTAPINSSQPNSDAGGDRTFDGEPESIMQVDYDVELEIDGTATKPKEGSSPRRASPKGRFNASAPYVLRVGAQDRRTGSDSMYASQKPVSLLTASYAGESTPKGNSASSSAAKRASVAMKQAGTIEVYNCAECGATFAMRRDLRMHVARTAHKPFKCPECARLFKDWQGLEGHALKHIGAKPWTCARCQRAYYSRPATLCHIETVHAVELEHEAQKYAQLGGTNAFGSPNSFALGSARSRNRKGAPSLHSQTQVQALIKRIAYDAATKQFLAKLRRANMTAIPATRSAVARAFTNTTAAVGHEQALDVDVKLESELDFVASNTELAAAYDEEAESGDEAPEYEYYDEEDEVDAESGAYEEDEEC